MDCKSTLEKRAVFRERKRGGDVTMATTDQPFFASWTNKKKFEIKFQVGIRFAPFPFLTSKNHESTPPLFGVWIRWGKSPTLFSPPSPPQKFPLFFGQSQGKRGWGNFKRPMGLNLFFWGPAGGAHLGAPSWGRGAPRDP